MAMRTKGWLLAGAGAAAFGLTALTAGEARAAFVPGTVNGSFSGMTVLDTFVDEQEASSCGDKFDNSCNDTSNIGTYPGTQADNSFGGASEAAVKFYLDELLGPDISLTSASSLRVNVPESGNSESDKGKDALFTIPEDDLTGFAYLGIKYGQRFAFFELTSGDVEINGLDFELSNYTAITPLPAAAWMMIGGLGLIGGAVKWRRRATAAAEA